MMPYTIGCVNGYPGLRSAHLTRCLCIVVALAPMGRSQSHPRVALPTLLPLQQQSGLNVAQKTLQNVEDISFCTLSQADVVRNPRSAYRRRL